MPKTEKSQSEKLKYFVRIFGKNVLETDGKILLIFANLNIKNKCISRHILASLRA